MVTKLFVVPYEDEDGSEQYAIVCAPTHVAAATYVWNELPGSLQRTPANHILQLSKLTYELSPEELEVGGVVKIGRT